MTSATEHAFTAGGTGAARPLKLALLFSILGEAVILLVWGFYLFPKGSWFIKTMWTLVYCGVGMGGAFGAVLVLGLLGRVDGWRAVGLTALLSTVMLGLFCNTLCLRLDMTFGYFGAQGAGLLFMLNGIVMSALGGAVLGWMTFTDRGRAFGPDWLK